MTNGIYQKRVATFIATIISLVVGFFQPLLLAVEPSNVSPSITTPQITPAPALQETPKIQLSVPITDQLPEGAEQFRFTLKQLEIDGAFGDIKLSLPKIYAEYIDQEITVVDLFNISRTIERTYHEAGFFLVRVLVPVQTIEAGIARLTILSGRISHIETANFPKRYVKKVLRLFDGLVDVEHLLRQELERKLLLANSLSGLTIEATLTAGDEPGTVILIMEGRSRLISGNLAFDNYASKELGKEQGLLFVSLNSALQGGEAIYAGWIFHPSLNDITSHQPTRMAAVAGLNLPLGNNGWMADFEVTRSVNHPQGDLAPLQSRARLNRWAAGLSYPMIVTRQNRLSVHAQFEYVDEVFQTDLTGSRITLTHDSIRSLRFSVTYLHQNISGNIFTANGRFSQGLDAFGARIEPTANVALSRNGGSADYTKLETDFGLRSPMPMNMLANFTFKGQISASGVLLVPEQFSIGGSDFGSGQDLGAIIGDDGFAARVELERLFSNTNSGAYANARPYVFFDYGWVNRRQPTAVEEKNTTVVNTGIGIRFSLIKSNSSSPALNASLEYAFRLDGPADKDTGDRASFILSFGY